MSLKYRHLGEETLTILPVLENQTQANPETIFRRIKAQEKQRTMRTEAEQEQ